MEWQSILLGFAMGLSSTILAIRIQRSWQEFDENRFIKRALESLVVEIQNGLVRTKNLVSMADEGKVSFVVIKFLN